MTPDQSRTGRSCSVDGCETLASSGGMCSKHYARWRRHGSPYVVYPSRQFPRAKAKCSIQACDRPVKAKGLCDLHYKRQRKGGDPAVKNIPVRTICIVEDCDRLNLARGYCSTHLQRVNKWGTPEGAPRRLPKGYRVVRDPDHPLANSEGRILQHRKILYDTIGVGPHPCHWCGRQVEWRTGSEAVSALVVDHLDHDKLNNDPSNLVPACNACNGKRLKGENWTPWAPGMPVSQPRFLTRCRKGHLLTAENLYVRPDTGQRRCLTCRRAYSKRKGAERTGKQRAPEQETELITDNGRGILIDSGTPGGERP